MASALHLKEVGLSHERTPEARAFDVRSTRPALLCIGCRANEARYGLRIDGDDTPANRRRTLCFECFRVEVVRRQAVAAWLAREQSAKQLRSLDDRLGVLSLRRRRAQITARHALDV